MDYTKRRRRCFVRLDRRAFTGGETISVRTFKTIMRISLAALLFAAGVGQTADKSPGQAYLEFHAVLKQSFSDSAIWPYHIRSAREDFEKQFPPNMRGRAFYIMKSSAPAAVRVAEEKIEGDTATLVLIPTGPSQADRGDAIMRLEDGVWKLEKVVWRVP